MVANLKPKKKIVRLIGWTMLVWITTIRTIGAKAGVDPVARQCSAYGINLNYWVLSQKLMTRLKLEIVPMEECKHQIQFGLIPWVKLMWLSILMFQKIQQRTVTRDSISVWNVVKKFLKTYMNLLVLPNEIFSDSI